MMSSKTLTSLPSSEMRTADAISEEGELLVCDTTIVSMLRYITHQPQKLAHWGSEAIYRLGNARLGLSVVSLAEAQFGWRKREMPPGFVEQERRRIDAFALLPIDPTVIDEWGRLKVDTSAAGTTCGDNDLWIAATGSSREATVVTADSDFLPLAAHTGVWYLKRKPDSRDA